MKKHSVVLMLILAILATACPNPGVETGTEQPQTTSIPDASIFMDAGQSDMDGDTIPDSQDNCPAVSNRTQANFDGDDFGDACDNCPTDPLRHNPSELNPCVQMVQPEEDAGQPDASEPPDASPIMDAGQVQDAGTEMDAGPPLTVICEPDQIPVFNSQTNTVSCVTVDAGQPDASEIPDASMTVMDGSLLDAAVAAPDAGMEVPDAGPAPAPCSANPPSGLIHQGSLIKGSLPAVYYVGANGKRYVFPSDKVYKTWYSDFSTVQTISDADLASLMIGGNVTYKPGSRLLKIRSDPAVYAVEQYGVLRRIASESVASDLYGTNWMTLMTDDIPDAFFSNYTVGQDITSASQFNPTLQRETSDIECATAGCNTAQAIPVITGLNVGSGNQVSENEMGVFLIRNDGTRSMRVRKLRFEINGSYDFASGYGPRNFKLDRADPVTGLRITNTLNVNTSSSLSPPQNNANGEHVSPVVPIMSGTVLEWNFDEAGILEEIGAGSSKAYVVIADTTSIKNNNVVGSTAYTQVRMLGAPNSPVQTPTDGLVYSYMRGDGTDSGQFTTSASYIVSGKSMLYQ